MTFDVNSLGNSVGLLIAIGFGFGGFRAVVVYMIRASQHAADGSASHETLMD